jgi:alkylation response protein AidB-like acyl-CoA dehydrogenase
MGWRDGCAFLLNDEELSVQVLARDFAEKEVAPRAAELDARGEFPGDIIAKLGTLGFLGAVAPDAIGGSDLSSVAYSVLIEELAAACASTAIIVSAHNSLCLWPVVYYGTPEQHQRFGRPLATGKTLGCFALSEPGTGSDAASLTCHYCASQDKFIVSGTKNWITNAPDAGVCVLLATSDITAGYKGVSAFVHDMNLPGILVGKHEDKLGIRASSTASITYDGVELSRENLLGVEGKGFSVAMNTLNGGRIGVAAQAIGIARAALTDALHYGKERKTFGKAIVEHQSIQNYLADMITGIDAARYLTLAAARKKDAGLSYAREAAQAKLFASRVAMDCADKGIQIHGGYGYVRDYPAERHLRDAKITEIYEGTTEIQRIVIASSLVREDP